MNPRFYDIATLAAMSDEALDELWASGAIQMGDVCAAKLERSQRAEREAAMMKLLAGDAGFDEQRESYGDRIVRLCRRNFDA